MLDPNNVEALADKIRRGDELSAEETMAVFKTADAAGMLYYKMLTMVREQRSLSELPETLKEVIKTEAWKRWRWVGSPFAQNSLGAYLTSPPPNGVGIKLDTVEKLIADDPEALALYRKEMTATVGINQHTKEGGDIITTQPKRGTDRAYTLDRLKRERSDLFDRVVAKEMTANAAAIAAGFRKKPKPFDAILKLLPKLTDAERSRLCAILQHSKAT
jgi:hypothetical protein